MNDEVSIATKVHLWWTWMRIAARQAGAAKRYRTAGALPSSFESAESAALSREFEASLVAVSAVAFSLEAVKIELEEQGFVLDKSQFVKPPGKVTAGFYVAHSVIQAFDLKGPFKQHLPRKLDELFELRNEFSVHFKSLTREGTAAHPSGVDTAMELSVFTSEKSTEMVKLGREIFRYCVESVEVGSHNISASTIAKELPDVLSMLDEVIRDEQLS